MAKLNKYWGMVAIGALTAAAAGAMAAVLMKKKPVAEGPDFEDDFDDDAVSMSKSEDSRDGHEAFASWEPSESEDAPAEESADEPAEEAEVSDEEAEEESAEEAEEDSAEDKEEAEEAESIKID